MNVSIDILAGSACADAEARPDATCLPGVVTEEERTLLGIRQARDLVLAKNRELIDKLSHAEDQIAELTYERDDFMVARDVALKKVADLDAEMNALRAEFERLAEQQAALGEAEKVYVLARAEIEADLLELAEERDRAVAANRADALEILRLRTELETAMAAAPAVGSTDELQAVEQQLAEARQEHERDSSQQKQFIASLAEQLASTQRANHENQRKLEQLEAERNAALQQSIEEKAALTARVAALEAQVQSTPAPPDSSCPAPSPDRAVPLPGPPAPVLDPLSDQQVRDTIGSLFQKFEDLKAQPENPEPLAELESALRSFAERTRDSGLDLIHHMAAVSSDFAGRLRTTPGRLSAAILTFDQAFEMLGWLGLRGRAAMLEASGALVYAVDDDVDNCECLASAFEKVALQTKYSVRPEAALEQIAEHPCELIILDVDLPGMDGFELQAQIRQMPGHSHTPIIFLSGHLSTIERLAALDGANNEFVAKPYNLSELSLRALTLIVEARLG